MKFTICVLLVLAALSQTCQAEQPFKYDVYAKVLKPDQGKKMTNHSDECAGEFMCHSGAGQFGHAECVPKYKICDGNKNCANGADEHECPPCAAMGMMTCNDRRTCARSCDGIRDCPGQEDERYCPAQCAPSEYHCFDGKTCVPIRHLCDGVPHCPQGDDETECSGPCSCGAGHYLCSDGKTCIMNKQVCDNNHNDCPDDDDESKCPSGCQCSEGEYQCEGGDKCVPKSKLCDGTPDCPHEDDEGDVICVTWWALWIKIPD